MLTLAELKEGERGIITKVKGRGAFRKRIIEMGFIKGKLVTVGKSAPLMDPVVYQVMDSEISLRRHEASLIEVISEKAASNLLKKKISNGILSDEDFRKTAREKSKTIQIALVGNPNSGKTTLFNHASKSHEHVGNYAGVTVDSKKSSFKLNGYTFDITDLPGTYSLTYYTPEELFVRKHILEKVPDIVINVIDASNLERNLYLTTQLIDMDIKVIVALNMYDELRLKGHKFDYDSLGKMLGIPFVPTVASKGSGLNELFIKAIDVYEDREPSVRHIHINYGNDIEDAISVIQDKIKSSKSLGQRLAPRYYALKLIEKDQHTIEKLDAIGDYNEVVDISNKFIRKLEKSYDEDSETIITDARYGFIDGALRETFKVGKGKRGLRSKKIDLLLTGKYLSYPIFVFLIWMVFQATFIVGKYPVMWIENVVDYLGLALGQILPDSIIKDLVVDGIVGGVGGVIIFLPNILILFFFLSLMEDSGYMARAAFIIDKLMHKIGLHGKSFIPMLMGFGCNVPAIMATRTIENKSDRLVTMMVIPFMSCSARYPVYILLISAFFTTHHGTILFSLYLLGVVIAGLIALLFKKTLFRTDEMPFVMELPPYRIPTIKSTLRHTWFKGKQYLKKMGGIILIASIVIWALGYFPRNYELTETHNDQIEQILKTGNLQAGKLNDSQKQEILRLETEKIKIQQEHSLIGQMGKFVEPALKPLGFDWKMGISLIAGSIAKEIVISTMGVLYQAPKGENEERGLIDKLQNESYQTGDHKGEHVFTPLIAFTFMVFVLIYFPCVAVIAAIKKESGRWKWSAFVAIYTTVLAWIVSFMVYQIGSLFIS